MGGYGLIGEKLSHSFSPRLHALLGDYPYKLYPLAPSELDGFMKNNRLDGFNVTIPYKRAVLPYLSELSDAARRIGSVNTVVRRADGSLRGDNTDYDGFLSLLGGEGAVLRGEKALVLGSGGAARTALCALRELGLKAVTVSRRGEDNYENLSRHRDAKLIVNATPVGMYPEVEFAPLALSPFRELRLALDLVYNPERTRFLQEAEALGVAKRGGLIMLVRQAVRAAKLFGTLREAEDAAMERALEALRREMRSVLLIGMPGAGKTTVGGLLSEMTGRRFFDTDEMVAREAGMSIPEIFAREGEAGFRARETRALALAAREAGAIVATGGGAVTRPENRFYLRLNGVCVLLERELDELRADGRPLSISRGIEALYRQRKPLYEALQDARYGGMSAPETARKIREDWL